MNAIQALNLRLKEREALVTQITEILQTDDRVAAAALTSSRALRQTDALSDLDILVIVYDGALRDFVPPRKAEAERFAAVVWCQDLPANAPPGGSYLGVGFRGTGYPQCSDWYWQPLSLATFPTPAIALVEEVPIRRVPHRLMSDIVRAGRPRCAPPPPSPDFTPADPIAGRWSSRLAFFWRMTGVAAVKLARGEVAEAEQICSQLAGLLTDLAGQPAPDMGSGFARLRSLCAFAESLIKQASALGAIIPPDRTWVLETIDFLEALTQSGWCSPKTRPPTRIPTL